MGHGGIVDYIRPMRSVLRLSMTTAVVCVTLQAQPSVSLQTPQKAPQPTLIGVPAPAAKGAKPAAGDWIYQTTKVHKIHLTLTAAEWAVLQTSGGRGTGGSVGGSDYRDASGRLIHTGSGFGGYYPWVRADARMEDGAAGGTFKDAGLRYKGNLSFSRSSAAAPLFANFKLKLDVHDTKGTWDGEKTFNLHAGVVDTSKMRDAIAYSVFRAAGVPAPRTAYAELVFTVPGQYQSTSAGLFTLIEDVNKKFLERVLRPGTGLLMKPEGARGGIQSLGDSWAQYVHTYRPDREATPHEQRRVMEFGRLISQRDVSVFRSTIREYLDVDAFLRFIAVNALIANTDSYLRGGHNFYLYLDPADDKFRFIPWDQDLAMGRPNMGNFTANFNAGVDILRPANTDQLLVYWVLEDPAVHARYVDILRDLSARVFTEAELMRLIDALETTGAGQAGSSPREFLRARVAYVQNTLRQRP